MESTGTGRSEEILRVAVIDPHPLFRSGVVHSLQSSQQVRVVAEGASAADAVRITRSFPVDVVLLDTIVQGDWLQAIAGIARAAPASHVVILSASEEPAVVTAALQNGARGYLLKDVSGQSLLEALRAVAGGDVYLTPSLGARLLSRTTLTAVPSPSKGPSVAAEPDLTAREHQIISQVSVGATNKEIANTLNITEKTVKCYMTSIMQKLQVRNRVEAVVAIQDRVRARA